MQLRKTIMFIPKGESEVVKIKIFTTENLDLEKQGLWNIDSNEVLLSQTMYDQFSIIKDQQLQRKFFDQLTKVSKTQISNV